MESGSTAPSIDLCLSLQKMRDHYQETLGGVGTTLANKEFDVNQSNNDRGARSHHDGVRNQRSVFYLHLYSMISIGYEGFSYLEIGCRC
jgi:hypothetical protein